MRLLLPLLLVVAACSPSAGEGPLTVAAAASLRELMTDVAAAFAVEHGCPAPTLAFEASSTLARQIAAGAEVDLFFAADAESLERAGSRVDPKAARAFLTNELVLAVGAELAHPPRDLAELAQSGLMLGLAGPEVPVGRAARRYLTSLGLLEDFKGRIALGSNARSTLALLESGAVDAVLVYRTDAALAARARVVHVAPWAATEIAYYAASVEPARGQRHPRAAALLEFLASERFGELAAARGFSLAH